MFTSLYKYLWLILPQMKSAPLCIQAVPCSGLSASILCFLRRVLFKKDTRVENTKDLWCRSFTLYTEDRTKHSKHLTVSMREANDKGGWSYWQCGGDGMKCDVRQSMLVIWEKPQNLAAVTLWGRYGSWWKTKRWAQNAMIIAVTMNYAVGHEDKINLETECKWHNQLKKRWPSGASVTEGYWDG